MITEIIQGLASDWPITLAFTCCGIVITQLLIMLLKLKQKQASDAKQVASLAKEVALLSSGTVGMGHRMVQLQSKVDELVNQQGELADSEAQFAYTQALRLLEQGADENTVVANSGLSKSEIQLMQLVQGQKETA